MSITDVDTIREVTRAAAAIFTEAPRRSAAVTYLRQRGIDASRLAAEWVIGFAPPGWTRLVDQLRTYYPEQALIDAGVAFMSRRGTLIDAFRHRVMFGIHHADGTVAGFIGRDLSGHPDAPKYLNTRRHALFDKGKLLFGLYEGTQDANSGQPVVVEGPLDVLAIAARQDSIEQCDLLPVAACGTSFTPAHAAAVANVASDEVVVAMDGDSAGRTAALMAGEWLRDEGLEVRVAMMPIGSDPAEYLARSGRSLDTFRAEFGLSLIQVHAEDAIARQPDGIQSMEGRLAALRAVTAYIATYPVDVSARQIPWLVEALKLDGSLVTFELVEAHGKQSRITLPQRLSVAESGAALTS